MSKAKEIAANFLETANKYGFAVATRNGVVTVSTTFAKGDHDAFTHCDALAPGLLSMLGAKGGSVWGTDGASIGGASGLNGGYFRLNVSGVPKRVESALKKLLET